MKFPTSEDIKKMDANTLIKTLFSLDIEECKDDIKKEV